MNKLKETRESLKITQVEAADLLNISRRTYQKYESDSVLNEDKLDFYIYKLSELHFIDEDHGMLSVETIEDVVKDVLSKYDVNFCYLFGSYAKGKAIPTSDVDLVIDSNVTGLDFFGLVEELREALHKRVDLLKLDQLNNNETLLREVMKDGIKIYG